MTQQINEYILLVRQMTQAAAGLDKKVPWDKLLRFTMNNPVLCTKWRTTGIRETSPLMIPKDRWKEAERNPRLSMGSD